MSAAQGECLCGEIRYTVAQQPSRVTLCHCAFCQKATGAAYMVQPAFAASDLTVTQGSPAIYSHRSAGSGKKIHINFCRTCGTKLFQTFERFEGAIGLYRGTLDDPNWIKITPENAKHIFVVGAADETILPAQTPVYSGHALQNDGTAIAPITFDAPRAVADMK